MSTARPALLALLLLPTVTTAQSYRDLTTIRRLPTRSTSLLQIRAGASYVIPEDEDEAAGRESLFSGVGHVLYRAGDFSPGGHSGLTAYAGQDGALVSWREPIESGQTAIFEASGRYVPWYREGFYQGDDWVPTGRYGGHDYGAYIGFSSYVDDDISLEFGPFYRRYTFDRNESTDPAFTLPEDYDTYGGRIYLEHNTLTTDRDTDLPLDGFIFTVRVDYERNNSDAEFGTQLWRTSLPEAVWRGVGHLEWYFPTGQGASASDAGTWWLQLEGGVAPEEDRVWMFDAQKPIGQIFGDAKVGYRFGLGGGLTLLPYGNLQYTQTLDERGISASDDLWFGGGVDLRWTLGRWFAFWAEYSYLNNPNRPSISFTEDIYGEHQFFAGVELRFGN